MLFIFPGQGEGFFNGEQTLIKQLSPEKNLDVSQQVLYLGTFLNSAVIVSKTFENKVIEINFRYMQLLNKSFTTEVCSDSFVIAFCLLIDII